MSAPPVSVSPAWTAAGWTMLHLVWIGAVGGLVIALLRRVLRPARPEIRHGVAVACLLALTAAPVILFAWLYRPDSATSSAPAQTGRITPAGRATVDTAPLPALDLRRPGVEVLKASPAPISSRFEPLVGYLPGVWLGGSMVTLALLAAGLVGVERLRRSSRPLEAGAIAQHCRALAASLGVARRVGVAICDRLAAPVLIGVIRPLILLPPAAMGGWSIEQVEMALLHELAHIRRHDNLVTLLQRFVESLLFFHPVTWWLSAWVSLERELCCDRLVVEHTGRPEAYARMLAALAGAGPEARTLALAMAERPLTTRIRRILDMEDRSMKVTLTEGLMLLAAMVAGTTLTAHAGPAEALPADAARRTLVRLAEGIVALPDSRAVYGDKDHALLQIARAQLKLGDRAASLATLQLLDDMAKPRPPKPGEKTDLRAWERFGALAESAVIRRDAGDLDGARAALGRAARYFEILDDGATRRMIENLDKDADTSIVAKKPSTPMDEESEVVGEAATVLIDRCVAVGDMARARALIHRVLESVGPPRGPMKAVIIGVLGGYLIKAGDPDVGRDLIDRARRAMLALPEPEARAFALPFLARTMSESGDLDGALALVRDMKSPAQGTAFGMILAAIAVDDTGVAMFDLSGMNIKIGDPTSSPKDPAAARLVLPKIAAAARGAGDARVQARTLAIVAHLQARAGDFPGALATARSIPELKRSDFPGPNDGFYDAVKPVTFALVAGVQAEAGDRPAAVVVLQEAEALARAVQAEDQKLVSQIVLARKFAECGRRDAAKSILAEALPLTLAQPEPRRSRMLIILAEAQVQADHVDGATRTIDAIRAYPGLEKARALQILARRYEEKNDATTAGQLLSRAAACLASKAPEAPLPGKVMNLPSFGRDTFIDYDLEQPPGLIQYERESMLQFFRTRSGDHEAAVRAAKALPLPRRDVELSQIAAGLAHRGDVARALDLAASIESSDARLTAFVSLAVTIADRQTRK